ncbi:glycosyltransferase [Clostridium butyricum]|uniref:glycosyltransferase n=1 Tax=Clostridium butyricum TaxID=1492 RepID=UPI00374E8F7E
MNIVLYKGNFSYNVVNYFVDELYSALGKKHNVEIIDLKKITYVEELVYIIKDKSIDMIIAFNGVGIVGDNSIYDDLGIIFCALLVDNPYYHFDRITNVKSAKTFFGIYDEGAIGMAEDFIENNKIYTNIMHGGSFSRNLEEKKKYDISILGSINEEYMNVDKQLKLFKNDFSKRISKNLIERIIKNKNITVYECMHKIIEETIPEDIRNLNEFKEECAKIFIIVDRMLRMKNRHDVISALIEHGIEVNYFGHCKCEKFNKNGNFVNHGPIEYEKGLEVMAKSKIVINDLPLFKNGSHERIFSSMLNKALVISNKNNYCFDIYKDKEGIVFFDNTSDLVEKVKYYLENDQERKTIIDNAYELTIKYNTWENRANEILEIYNVIKNMQ